MTKQCCQPWESRVCVCVCVCVCLSEARLFTWNLLQTSHPVSSFLGNVSQTEWQHWLANPKSHVYMCVRTRGVYIFRNFRCSVFKHIHLSHIIILVLSFLTEGNIPISLHVLVFVLTVEQDIVLIHDAVFFFLHVCAFCVSTGAFRR
jgi:hypothetical protein